MFEQLAHSIPYNPNTPGTVWALYLITALLYCSPIIIGFYRHVEHKWWLYFTSLFLGFTGIAWVACLYYAIFSGRGPAKAPAAAV
jgi:uncharacterized membrane protein